MLNGAGSQAGELGSRAASQLVSQKAASVTSSSCDSFGRSQKKKGWSDAAGRERAFPDHRLELDCGMEVPGKENVDSR